MINYFAVFDNKFQFTNVIDEVFLQSKQFVYLYLKFFFWWSPLVAMIVFQLPHCLSFPWSISYWNSLPHSFYSNLMVFEPNCIFLQSTVGYVTLHYTS